MKTLTTYFTNQIGQTLRANITTGLTYYTQVYQRAYAAEIISVGKRHVTVNLTSHDRTPSGYRLAGSEKQHGERRIDLRDCAGLTDFWQRLVVAGDPTFALIYGSDVQPAAR